MTETWKGRVLREAQERAATLEQEVEPLLAELAEVRSVIRALEGREPEPEEPSPAPAGAAEKPEPAPAGGKAQKKRSEARRSRGAMREPVPPELAEMPAVRGRKYVSKSMIAAARKELSVWERVPHDRAFIVSEIETPIGMLTPALITHYLKRFFDAGLLIRTGLNRKREGMGVGRASPEYRVPTAYMPSLEEVRDLITHSWLKTGKAFTVAQVVETTGGVWAEGPTRIALGTLAERGTLRGEGDGYVYVKPEGGNPSNGGNGTPAPQRPVSQPVAGTGGGKGASNKEVRELMDAVKKQGATVSSGGKHPVVRFNGGRVKLATTPSDVRTLANVRADLRRIGLDV